MADTILTITQIEDLFQSVTSQILGTTDPSAVRIGWPTDGAPGWEINQDVCFILVNFNDDPTNQQIETSYQTLDSNDATVNTTYTQGVRVSWTIYGPNSFNNAGLIRSSLVQENYRNILAASNVALVTAIPMPTRVPELFNSQWWERSSFYANFNELVNRQSSVPYLQGSNVQILEG